MILAAGGGFVLATAVPQFNIVQGTNAPVPSLDFAVNDIAMWNFIARNYTGGDITVTVQWYSLSATTGNVKWEASLGAITGSSDTTNVQTKAYAAATSTQTATSGSTKALNLTTITITGSSLDSIADGDYVQFQIKRITATSEMTGSAALLLVNVAWS